MPVRRRFISWGRPLLPQAVEYLARDWQGAGPLDLRGILVVVPTKQAGRRLREGIAAFAEVRGGAAFPPEVVTPEALVAPDPTAGAASRLDSHLAWVEVLKGMELSEFRELFPIDPPARGFGWALRAAEKLVGVQKDLAEAGLRMGGVLGRAGAECPEIERWKQLGELERRYDERLRRRGLRDGQEAKIAAAQAPSRKPNIERIAVVGTPDPMPLAAAALAAHARSMPVDVLVFAPEQEAGNFDEWGRPLAECWGRRVLALSPFEERVRLCADPAEQAAAIAELARGYGRPEGMLAVGVADSDVRPVLESVLRRAGLEPFDPEGRLRREGEIYPLLAALRDLIVNPAFEAAEVLGRCPAILGYLPARIEGSYSAARWLAGLDELRRRHLPADLASARERAAAMAAFPELEPGLRAIEEVREALVSGGFGLGAAAALGKIFEKRKLDLGREADARVAGEATDWMASVRECAAAAERWKGLEVADCWDLALRLFGEMRGESEKPKGAVELQGWLELLWEDAPHLVVGGMNDGCVPEAVVGDAFLPEALREKLGLKGNAARFARDAYLLEALACSRGGGRLELLLGKTSAVGEPKMPSRLLLRCEDADLPRRAEFLFRQLDASRPHLPWTRAWRLEPREAPPQATVAVTALRDWLKCPFRFYLRHVLRMAPVEVAKTELDGLDFGTLCHEVLETMGRDGRWRDCTDAGALGEFLSEELERRVRASFGASLALPLVIQRDAARRRLGTAARAQARERAAGWRIEEVEKRIEIRIGGLWVRGQVDRVDRHVETGAVRVLDYKTADVPKAPPATHLRSLRRNDPVPDWARCEVEGRARAWSDLQLPFYRMGLADEFPGVSFGYFNLPKALGDTGLEMWEAYSPQLHESAVRCAEGVCEAIRRGEFWPPAEGIPPAEDRFASLFHHGAAASVAWRAAT